MQSTTLRATLVLILLLPLAWSCKSQGSAPTPEVRSGTIGTALAVTPTPAATPTCDEQSAYQRLRPSVVLLFGNEGQGSGFAISSDQVLTAAHVANQSSLFAITSDGRRIAARLVRSDSIADLAVLTLPGASLPAVSLGREEDIHPGARVLALGFPSAQLLGTEPTLTSGIISAIRDDGGVGYIQTDTALNPGSSGGPLFGLCGEVLGTVVRGLQGTVGLNEAVSLRNIDQFLGSTVNSGPSSAAPGASVDAVRLFYELLQQREYAQAYALLSSSYRQAQPYSQWLAGYSTTESIQIEFIQQDATANLVNVSVLAVDLLPTGRVTRRFAGQWQLVQEGSEWRLDIGRIRQVPY